MKIFQRVDKLLQFKKKPRTYLAEKLGVPQNTFNRYFKDEDDEKLAPHLWRIHELYSDISRNWLFFDEGEMLDAVSERTVDAYDQDVLEKSLRILEEELGKAKKHLVPKRKARAVRLMYQISMTGVSDAELTAIAAGLLREDAVNEK